MMYSGSEASVVAQNVYNTQQYAQPGYNPERYGGTSASELAGGFGESFNRDQSWSRLDGEA
jgi:hypothetical protein